MCRVKDVLLITLFVLILNTIYVFAANHEDDIKSSLYESPVYKDSLKYEYVNFISVDALAFDSFVKNPQAFEKTTDIKGAGLYNHFFISSEGMIYSAEVNNVFYDNYDESKSSFVIWNNIETGSYYNILSKDTFEFMKLDNINKILKINNINAKASKVYLINVNTEAYSYFPAVIWIKAEDNSNHFFVFNGNGGATAYCRFDTKKLIYMNYSDFYKKYAIRKGILYINGIDINTDKLMFQANNYMYIPFRELIEGLGSKVNWNQDDRSVTFNCNGTDYTLYNDLSGLIRNYKNENVFTYYNLMPFIDNKMYINKDVLSDIADMFDMTCEIDFVNNIVYLQKK